jgi:hypothetical protein
MTKFWIARLLFCLTLALAAGLILLVILSPWLDNKISARLLAVFAEDKTVRRTALASGLGLIVTACVFFLPKGTARRAPSKERQPPSQIPGA